MSEPEKNLKESKLRSNQGFGEFIVSSAWRSVPFFAFFGILISYVLKLTMNRDVWFWFFSSIAQTFAALVALVAIFLLSRLELYNATIDKNKDIMRSFFHEYGTDEAKYFDDKRLIIAVDSFISEIEPKLKTVDITKNDSINPHVFKALIIKKARYEYNRLEIKKRQAKNQMETLLKHTLVIIMLSIFLIPFGSVNTEDSFLLALWNNFNLKWAIIFGLVGLCIASLHKVESMLNEILFKEE